MGSVRIQHRLASGTFNESPANILKWTQKLTSINAMIALTWFFDVRPVKIHLQGSFLHYFFGCCFLNITCWVAGRVDNLLFPFSDQLLRDFNDFRTLVTFKTVYQLPDSRLLEKKFLYKIQYIRKEDSNYLREPWTNRDI